MACRCNTFTFDFGSYFIGSLGPDQRVFRLFQPSMDCLIVVVRSRTEPTVPRRLAWPSMMPNQTSTRLSHDPEVEVKCTWILGFAVSQS